MSRARLLVENVVVYGFGGMLAKLVPFLMLPIVTRLMPGTSYFGISDLANSLTQFAQSVAVMGLYDAMFRLFFERDNDEDYRRSVCTTALYFVTGCSLIVALCIFLFSEPIARLFFGGSQFASLAAVSAVSTFIGGNGSIVQAPTRMQNRRSVFVIMNLVTSILSYSIAIPMLLSGEYLMALPVSSLLASLTSLCVFMAINRCWFRLGYFDCGILRELLAIGVPLMPSFIFYWVLSSADRVLVMNLLGDSAAGIFAAASKIGQVSQLIYTAFAQGWQFFAFSTMHDQDQVQMTSRIYEMLGAVSFIVAGTVTVLAEPIFSVFYPSAYASGSSSVPLLFLAPLLLMLYQVAVNQLLVVKKTWPSLLILAIAGFVNVATCVLLVGPLGVEGAAIATIMGYLSANALILAVLTRHGLISVQPRLYLAGVTFSVFYLLCRIALWGSPVLMAFSCSVFMLVVLLLYRDEVIRFLGPIIKRKVRRRG